MSFRKQELLNIKTIQSHDHNKLSIRNDEINLNCSNSYLSKLESLGKKIYLLKHN